MFETIDTIDAERIVHDYLNQYRISSKKEWFRAPKEVIAEAMENSKRCTVSFGQSGLLVNRRKISGLRM